MARVLHTVLAAIWQSGTIPPALLRDDFQSLWNRHEFCRELLAAYINLKKAFDSVYPKSPWKILRLWVIVTCIIEIIASLYIGTESAVKDWIMGRASIQNPCGTTLGNIKVMDLDFADDVLSESLESGFWWRLMALDAFKTKIPPSCFNLFSRYLFVLVTESFT
ncbi:uncharacterized protein [Penaeus vannamei]|uniref:uncharacterized protein n=1 Tax=Penaeus vannamei TaxID=6689 RepID=UPI00387F7CDC